MKKVMIYSALSIAIMIGFTGCGKSPEQLAAEAAAQQAAIQAKKEQQAKEIADLFNQAVEKQQWETANMHGIALVSEYPDTDIADKIKPQLPDIKIKAETAYEKRRLAGLWSYANIPANGGIQYTADIYSKNKVDVDGKGEKTVQWIFRDHPEWKRSSYLVLKGGDFDCYSGCNVQIKLDDGKFKPISAWRPKTDEAIAMFINNEKVLWKQIKSAKQVEIQFPVKAGGTRTVIFETGGLDSSKLPAAWN